MMELDLIVIKKPSIKLLTSIESPYSRKEANKTTSESSGAGKHSPSALRQGHSPSDRKESLCSMISMSSKEYLICTHDAFSTD